MVAAGAAMPGETAEQRRKRKERERQEAEERRKREKQSSVAASAIAAARTKDNSLHRDTPYVCDIRFTNMLPEVPSEPKMMADPPNYADLARFRLTAREAGGLRDTPLSGPGAQVSLLDAEAFQAPLKPPPLAAEDAALVARASLTAPTVTSPAKVAPVDAAVVGGAPRLAPAARPVGTELSWLMRTTYISAESGGRVRGSGMPEQAARAARAAAATGAAQPQGGDEEARRAEAVAAVEASFEAATRPPVHPTNPALAPTSVLPLVPDLAAWGWPLALLAADFDLLDGVPAADAASPAQRAWLQRAALLKSYAMGAPGEPDPEGLKRFVALMVPRDLPPDDACATAPALPADGREVALEWVAEFSYAVEDEPAGARRPFLFVAGDDAVRYTPMDKKLILKKRPPKAGRVPRARDVGACVGRAPIGDAKLAADTLAALLGPGHPDAVAAARVLEDERVAAEAAAADAEAAAVGAEATAGGAAGGDGEATPGDASGGTPTGVPTPGGARPGGDDGDAGWGSQSPPPPMADDGEDVGNG